VQEILADEQWEKLSGPHEVAFRGCRYKIMVPFNFGRMMSALAGCLKTSEGIQIAIIVMVLLVYIYNN
jgi:hypothetical protein